MLVARRLSDQAIEAATEQAYGQLRSRFGIALPKDEAGARLSGCYALYRLIRPEIDAACDGRPVGERLLAADAYAWGMAARATLGERLAAVPRDGYRFRLGVSNGDPDARERLVLDQALRRHERLAKERPHLAGGSAEQLLKALYEEASRTVASLPEEVRRKVVALPFEIRGTTYRGLEEGSSACLPAMAASGSLDNVVGNRRLREGAGETLRMLLHYDAATGKNCYIEAGERIPVASLTYGPTGTGKTLTWSLLMQEAEETAGRLGLTPVLLHPLDASGRTSLINSGREALESLFKKLADKGATHLVLGDEIDTLIYGPERTGNNVEEAKIEGDFLRGMTRLEMARTGNVHCAFITNNLERLAERVRARLQEATYEALGPQTAEEHARLLLQELDHFRELGLLRVEDAALIGERSRSDYRFSGRDLKNIAVAVSARSRSPSAYVPDRPLWEQSIDPSRDAASVRAERRAHGVPIDDALLLSAMEEYAAGLKRREAEAREALVAQGVAGQLLAREVRRRLLEEFPDGEPDTF